MPAPSTPYYTDEQWQQLAGLADLSGKEQAIAQQQALAQQLRAGGGNRIDTASQIGRGMSGIGSALMNYKAMQGQKQLGTDRSNWLDQIRRAQMGGGGPVQEQVPGQFSMGNPSYG